MINERVTQLKEWIIEIYQQRRLPSKSLLIKLAISGLILLFMIFFVRHFNNSIRKSQIDSLLGQQINESSLEQIPYDKLEETIADHSAITILFVAPNAENYEKLLDQLKDHKSGLNRKFYIYPIIYSEEKIFNKYKLTKDQATFIFFQNEAEKNRLVYDTLKNPNKELSDSLNRLPMWNITDTKKSN